jgi:hypothetical protein
MSDETFDRRVDSKSTQLEGVRRDNGEEKQVEATNFCNGIHHRKQ